MGPARPRVAVLDDDADFASLMAGLLDMEGMEPVLPAVPPDAELREVLAGGHYELAIIDLRGIARGDVAEIERVRGDDRLADMPILVCSADVQLLRDHASRLSALSGVLALEKPFRLEVLSGALERLLRGSSVAPAAARPPDAEAVDELQGWLADLGARIRWPVMDVWIADQRPGLLRCIATWTVTPSFEPFASLSRRTHLPIGGGIPGRTWVSGRPTWIADLTTDLNFPRLGTAREVGLVSAAAAPVIDDDATIAVISAYTTMRRPNDARVASELDAAGRAATERFRRLVNPR